MGAAERVEHVREHHHRGRPSGIIGTRLGLRAAGGGRPGARLAVAGGLGRPAAEHARPEAQLARVRARARAPSTGSGSGSGTGPGAAIGRPGWTLVAERPVDSSCTLPAARSPSHATSESCVPPRDPDRPERREMAGQRAGVGHLRPQFGAGLHEGSLGFEHRPDGSPAPAAIPSVRGSAHALAARWYVHAMEGAQRPLELILARNLLASLSTPAFLSTAAARSRSTTSRRALCWAAASRTPARCRPPDGRDLRARSTTTASRSPSTSSTLTAGAARRPPGARRASHPRPRRRRRARSRPAAFRSSGAGGFRGAIVVFWPEEDES